MLEMDQDLSYDMDNYYNNLTDTNHSDDTKNHSEHFQGFTRIHKLIFIFFAIFFKSQN